MKRTRITKIGLLNYWLYDEEEFDFYGGKLILRGENGTGKSVTMQSFIPLILDGNKSPERLDPFGSKERKIEDYIIGSADSIQKDEATSYLYMETYNEQTKQYITVGLGFRGRKGRPVESWGFALKDGKRVNKDFYLYKDLANKIPLTKNELKSRLGTVNEFTDNTKDYKAMVNRLLFNFPNLELYDEFIKLLLQLRSNKLSKDYKPTNLIDVLNKVLQPLTEEDLRPLSEAIEQMNKTKEQIETLEKNNKSLQDFMKIFHNYNATLLYTKAKNYKNSSDEYNNLVKKIKANEQELNDLENRLETQTDKLNNIILDISVNNETKRKLNNSKLSDLTEQLVEVTQNIENCQKKIEEISGFIANKKEEKIKIDKNIANLEDEIYNLENELTELSKQIKELADNCSFIEIKNYDLNPTKYEEGIFDAFLIAIRKYKERVNQILDLLLKEEQILNASESLRVDFEKLHNTILELEKNLNNQQNNFKESILSWEEDFINKINNNEELKLDEQVKGQIFKLMNDYNKDNFEEIKNIYNNYGRSLINNLTSENINLKNKLSLKKDSLNDLNAKYEEINQQDDLEIPSINKEADEQLMKNNIAYIPLYKCLEFKDNISNNIKNNLEAVLLDLNILNAKIIKEADIPKLKKLDIPVIYLTKSTKKKNNLLKYFDVKTKENINIPVDYISAILESISIDKEDIVSISETGQAKIDILNTIASKEYQQCFIGYLKRLELKKQQLKQLATEINVLTGEINNLNNVINNNNRKIEIINIEIDNLPSNKFINSILDKIWEIKASLNWNDEKQKELEKLIAKYNTELSEIKKEILNKKKDMTIPLNIPSFKEAINDLNRITEITQNYKNIGNSYLNKIDLKANYQERLEDLINDISYQQAEQNEKMNSLKVNEQNKAKINEILNSQEFLEQKDKLLKIEETLQELAKEKDKYIKLNTEITKDIEYKNKELESLKENNIDVQKYLEIYKNIFINEYNLHYVYEENLINIDNQVKKIIADNTNRKDKNLIDIERNFFSAYNTYSLELNEYSLRTIELFNNDEELDENLKQIYSANKRMDVTALYQGTKVNLITLANNLEENILESKDLISKQDRHLFEDILLNTVGEKIRNRINASNDWVKKINGIMKTMQEESALRFKLVWKSNTVSNEGEIDTKELVRILQMNPLLLKDKDREELTNHFRSKIKKAEELYKDSFTPFTKIIEDILDYRTWFTFQLFYERKGQDFKELTDKTFAKFSGGERAKSMYIPLFASVYAKLNLAKSDALRVIALDEAFAGVDDVNIREMFGILNYLDIDYIINSQFIWGDYDTVSDLAICELIRPQNSPVVTVERYRWNGKYKEIIYNRKEYNEENDA